MTDPTTIRPELTSGLAVTPLASGSQGNATLVEGAGVVALVDAGLPADELEERLHSVGTDPGLVDWIFVTHRHRDHVVGVRDFVRRHRCRVLCTGRVVKSLGTELHKRVRRAVFDSAQGCGKGRSPVGLSVTFHRIPHDAPETAALRIEGGGAVYGHLTDAGSIPDDLVAFLRDCDAVLVESNYDPDLLLGGEDPPHLKRRIGSGDGHLSNLQTAYLLERIGSERLQQVWLAHLSQRNNSPELAMGSARDALSGFPELPITVLHQDRPTARFRVHAPDERPGCVGVCQIDLAGVCIGCGRHE